MARLRSLLLAASVACSVHGFAEPQDSYASQTSVDTCIESQTQSTYTAAPEKTPAAFPTAATFNTGLPSSYPNGTEPESTDTVISSPAPIAVTKTQVSSLNVPVITDQVGSSAVTKTQETTLDGPAVTNGYVPQPSGEISTVDYTQSSSFSPPPEESFSAVLKTAESALIPDTFIVTSTQAGMTSAPMVHSTVNLTLSATPVSAQMNTTQSGLITTGPYETFSTYASAVTKTTQSDLGVSESPGVKTPGVTLGGPPGGYLPLPSPETTTDHASPATPVVTVVPTAGTYITAGATAVTVSGTTYSLAPSADSIYVNNAATTVPTGNALTWSSAASAYVTGGTTVTAGAPAVVVSGTTYSLARSAPALYVNGVASTVAPSGLRALAAAAGGQTTAIPWTALAGSAQTTGPATLTTAIVTPVPLQTTSSGPGAGKTSSSASPSLANDASDPGAAMPYGGVLAAALLAAVAYV